MEIVGSALGDNTYHATRGASYFWRVFVGLHGYFLNSIDRRFYANGSDDTLVIVGAVDQLIVENVIVSVHGKGAGLAAMIGTLPAAKAVNTGCFIDSRNKLDPAA